MTQYMRAYARLDPNASPEAPIRFVASTEGVKADGQDLRMEDWALDRYIKHPVVLYAHDYLGQTLPVGTGQPSFEDRDLIIAVTYDRDDDFAMKVRGKVIKGMMAGSVGWDTVQRDGKQRNELLEFSMVPVPMDPDALPQRQKRAWAEMGRELLALSDDEDPWTEAAAAMVELYLDRSRTSESERRKEYNRIARLYRLADKIPPEFMKLEVLAALGPDELAGLFLEGEAESMPEKFVRVGKVLSARNLGDLQQAVDLISGVIERAKKEAEQTSDGEPERGAVSDEDAQRILALIKT